MPARCEQNSRNSRSQTSFLPPLQGQRAARIEMLLAHEFHGRKFMLPDRLTARDRDRAAREAGEDAPSASGDSLFWKTSQTMFVSHKRLVNCCCRRRQDASSASGDILFRKTSQTWSFLTSGSCVAACLNVYPRYTLV